MITIAMKPGKQTKGTYVFVSVDKDAVVPTVYIKKSAFPNGRPDDLTLTLE